LRLSRVAFRSLVRCPALVLDDPEAFGLLDDVGSHAGVSN
jgi:hypothetical protein